MMDAIFCPSGSSRAPDSPGSQGIVLRCFGGWRVDARRLDVSVRHQLQALAEPGLHQLQTSGEVVAEDEHDVVCSQEPAVKPHAAAPSSRNGMLWPSSLPETSGLHMKRAAGKGSCPIWSPLMPYAGPCGLICRIP